jgi:cell division protein FtsN
MSLFIAMTVASCINKNTGYRVVGKDGKVIYFEKKRPILNEQQLGNKARQPVNTIQNVNNSNKNNGNEKNNKLNNELLAESGAYSLKSVIDDMVKDDDINKMAKTVQKNSQPKTIKDFNVPEYYFRSKSANTTVKNPTQGAEIKVNSDVKKESGGFFSIFKSKSKNTNVANAAVIDNINTTPGIKTGTAVFASNQQFGKNNVTNNKTEQKGKNNVLVINNSNNKKQNIATITTTTETIPLSNMTMEVDFLEKNKYYIQLGSFSDEKKAKKLIDDFKDVGSERKVVPVIINKKNVYRSVIGRFNTKKEADKEMEKILNRGHFDVFTFKK